MSFNDRVSSQLVFPYWGRTPSGPGVFSNQLGRKHLHLLVNDSCASHLVVVGASSIQVEMEDDRLLCQIQLRWRSYMSQMMTPFSETANRRCHSWNIYHAFSCETSPM